MSEATPEQIAPEETHDADNPPGAPGEERHEPAEQDNAANPSREAAKYRRQLREAEAEIIALRETVTEMQRAAVEQAAARVMKEPGAIWMEGNDPNRFVTEGRIDTTKVETYARELASKFSTRPSPVPWQGTGTDERTGGPQFSDAFMPHT